MDSPLAAALGESAMCVSACSVLEVGEQSGFPYRSGPGNRNRHRRDGELAIRITNDIREKEHDDVAMFIIAKRNGVGSGIDS